MLIEKTDFRNIELQNQMTVIENQLGNLTALELKNRSLHMDKYTVRGAKVLEKPEDGVI